MAHKPWFITLPERQANKSSSVCDTYHRRDLLHKMIYFTKEKRNLLHIRAYFTKKIYFQKEFLLAREMKTHKEL
jgi:hypothetical protein